jgi:hypothetical protein
MFAKSWKIFFSVSAVWLLFGLLLLLINPTGILDEYDSGQVVMFIAIWILPVFFVFCVITVMEQIRILEDKVRKKTDEINFLKNQTLQPKKIAPLVQRPIQTGNISTAPNYPELYKSTVEAIDKNLGWLHLKGSAIGFNKPELQDSHGFIVYEDAAVLIVADGAGSKKLSKKGADYCVKTIKEKLDLDCKNLLQINAKEWGLYSANLIFSVAQELEEFAKKEGVQISELGSTCIIVYASDKFTACTHVGDGRAGYLDEDGIWKSLMTPFKGSEANSTVFMTSLTPQNKDKYIQTCIVEKRVRAVVALSDGPESVCWNVSTKDKSGTKIIDPNIPSGTFFEKISNQLISASRSNVSQDELDKLWDSFLKAGNAELAAQVDDKTIVFALRG